MVFDAPSEDLGGRDVSIFDGSLSWKRFAASKRKTKSILFLSSICLSHTHNCIQTLAVIGRSFRRFEESGLEICGRHAPVDLRALAFQ